MEAKGHISLSSYLQQTRAPAGFDAKRPLELLALGETRKTGCLHTSPLTGMER